MFLCKFWVKNKELVFEALNPAEGKHCFFFIFLCQLVSLKIYMCKNPVIYFLQHPVFTCKSLFCLLDAAMFDPNAGRQEM